MGGRLGWVLAPSWPGPAFRAGPGFKLVRAGLGSLGPGGLAWPLGGVLHLLVDGIGAYSEGARAGPGQRWIDPISE